MTLDRRTVLASGLVGPALMAAKGAAAAQPMPASTGKSIKLWPGGAPGGEGIHVEYKSVEDHERGRSVGRSITGVTEPLVSVHRAARPSDTAILAIPGGGFRRAMYDKEGEDICRWLTGVGVSAGTLLYRFPKDGWSEDAPVADAKRAIRILARETGAKRIGVMGFSAGGTIAAAVATRWDEPLYTPVDAADQIDARPSFMVLGYPYLNLPAQPANFRSMYHGMTTASPPAFIFQAADDSTVSIENSIAGFNALVSLHVPAALHMFESGEHGFGLGAPPNSSAARWPDLFLTWAKAGGHIA
jgi:acetyl esterase/lipase